jgi:hypothetical protein
MTIKSRLAIGLICVVSTLLTPILRSVLAQSDENFDVRIFILQDHELRTVDPSNGSQQTVTTTPLPLESLSTQQRQVSERILLANVDATGNFIYTLEAIGYDSHGFPVQTQLSQLDVGANSRHLLLQRPGIINFSISPNQTFGAVTYYTGTYGESVKGLCLFNLQSRTCNDVPLRNGVGNLFYWLDEQTLLIRSETIQIVDVTTRQAQEIAISLNDWYVMSAAPIPNSDDLLVSVDARTDGYRPAQFLRYNLGTHTYQQLPYNAANLENYSLVMNLHFSREGQYLLYGGGLGRPIGIVEFSTGALLNEINTIITSGWLDNETLIVQGSRDGVTLEIFTLNAQSGTVTQLAQGEQAGGIMLVAGS